MKIKFQTAPKFLNRSDGLPSGQIHDIARDRDNIFWFAGPNGLARYDGTRIRTINENDGLSTHGLRSVDASADGRIWIGSDAGVDVLAPDGTILPLAPQRDWDFGFVKCIKVSADGTVWLGTADGLVSWTKTRGLQPVDDLRLNEGIINNLIECKDRKTWVNASKGGLLKYSSGKWRSLDSDEWTEVGGAISMAEAEGTGGIFIGGENGVVQINSQGKVIGRLREGRSEIVTALLNTGNELWAGIGGQLRLYEKDPDGWRNEQIVLDNVLLNKLYCDDIGNIWGATDSAGVVKISALRKAFRQIDLPGSGAVFAISQTPDNHFLLGGDQSSWKIKIDDELTADKLEVLSGVKVWDILADRPDSFFAATETGLQSICESNGFCRRIGADDQVLSSPGRALVKWKESIWAGTVSGLVEIKNGGMRETKDRQGRSLGYVYTIAKDRQDRLWIGTIGNGLWCQDANGIKKFSTESIKKSGNIYDIEIKADGTAAIIQDNRIIILSPEGKLKREIKTEDSVAGWSALWLGNRLWVGSSSGLHEYDPETGLEIRRITALTGVENWEFTTSRSLQSDHNGRLLCGLNSGLMIVDTGELEAFCEPPAVKLGKIDWSNAIVEENRDNGGGYVVAPGRWTVDVEAFVASYIDEDDARVRFRLVGFDKYWQKYDKNAVIRYNSLPSGKYRLEAQACIPLVGEGPVTKLFDLQVRQPWWSKGWLAIPYAASEAVLGLIEARSRNRRLLLRNLKLEERVASRTLEIESANRSLHQLNADLKRISKTDQLTGIANRRQFDETFDKELSRARRAEADLSLIKMDIDHFKDFNDTYGHQKGDECLQLVASAMAESFRTGGDLIARYGGEEFAAILPETDIEGARVIAERIRNTIEKLEIPNEKSSTAQVVTMSLGIASVKLGLSVSPPELISLKESLLKSADDALYRAKNAGRNRVAPSIAEVISVDG